MRIYPNIIEEKKLWCKNTRITMYFRTVNASINMRVASL